MRDFRSWIFLGPPRPLSPEEHARRARRLTELIAHLGPSFIKAIQVLAMREDLLPKAYTDQFKRLQDQAPPFPARKALRIIEEELGAPALRIFESFDPHPIAAASLGQVHRAVYRGRAVAVKIRRPGVERIVRADLAAVITLLQVISLFADNYILRGLRVAVFEFRRVIEQEMDFRWEARNAARLRENLRCFSRVIVPRCFEELTTERISAFEFHEGARVDDVARLRARGIQPDDLVGLLMEVYIHQVVIDGFVHADPHPGNLLLDPEGRLVILDFGMAVEIEPAVKKELLRLVRAVARGDTDGVVDGFYRLRLVEPGINPALLGDAARTLMNISIGTDLSPRRIQEICEDIYTTFHRFPLRLPQSLVYLLRASALVEGIGMAFDPNFNGLRAGRPVVKRMLSGVALEPEQPILDRLVGEVRRILRAAEDFLQILHETRRGQLQIRLHPADLEHLDRAYNAIVRRMMLGMGAVALALLGAFVHLRSGLWAFPIGCGATAALTWLYCLVFPLGKPPIPRGPSE